MKFEECQYKCRRNEELGRGTVTRFLSDQQPMMEVMGQTIDEGKSVAESSVKLVQTPERDVFCGIYYNRKMHQKENRHTAPWRQSNINKCQREGRTLLF